MTRSTIGVRTLVDEPFEGLSEIEEPVDWQRADPELEIVEVVVGAIEDRPVFVGWPRYEFLRLHQVRPVDSFGLVHGRRWTSRWRITRPRRRRR